MLVDPEFSKMQNDYLPAKGRWLFHRVRRVLLLNLSWGIYFCGKMLKLCTFQRTFTPKGKQSENIIFKWSEKRASQIIVANIETPRSPPQPPPHMRNVLQFKEHMKTKQYMISLVFLSSLKICFGTVYDISLVHFKLVIYRLWFQWANHITSCQLIKVHRN